MLIPLIFPMLAINLWSARRQSSDLPFSCFYSEVCATVALADVSHNCHYFIEKQAFSQQGYIIMSLARLLCLLVYSPATLRLASLCGECQPQTCIDALVFKSYSAYNSRTSFHRKCVVSLISEDSLYAPSSPALPDPFLELYRSCRPA